MTANGRVRCPRLDAVKREPVRSTTLTSVGYDPTTRTLEVEFRRGGVYQYFEVSEFLFKGLMLARSKGVFFNRNIEDRFEYRERPNAD